MFLSVIIPAYNEEKRLGATLTAIYEYFHEKALDYEVIVIDDGSIDGTERVAIESKIAELGELKVVTNAGNEGKGFSVKRGVELSKGDYVLISDADLSTPIDEFEKLFSEIRSGYDIVIGSRGVKESDVKVHQPWLREHMGKVFNACVKILLLKDYRDTQCGFKLFKGNIIREIIEEMHITGFCFDVEILYIAKIRKFKVKETGVIWKNSPQSKVDIINTPLSMFYDLMRIRRLHR